MHIDWFVLRCGYGTPHCLKTPLVNKSCCCLQACMMLELTFFCVFIFYFFVFSMGIFVQDCSSNKNGETSIVVTELMNQVQQRRIMYINSASQCSPAPKLTYHTHTDSSYSFGTLLTRQKQDGPCTIATLKRIALTGLFFYVFSLIELQVQRPWINQPYPYIYQKEHTPL